MTLLQAIMHQDDVSITEAQELIDEMKERVLDGEDPEIILYEEGYEPDYIL